MSVILHIILSLSIAQTNLLFHSIDREKAVISAADRSPSTENISRIKFILFNERKQTCPISSVSCLVLVFCILFLIGESRSEFFFFLINFYLVFTHFFHSAVAGFLKSHSLNGV